MTTEGVTDCQLLGVILKRFIGVLGLGCGIGALDIKMEFGKC